MHYLLICSDNFAVRREEPYWMRGVTKSIWQPCMVSGHPWRFTLAGKLHPELNAPPAAQHYRVSVTGDGANKVPVESSLYFNSE